MTKIKFNKKDVVSLAVGTIGGTSTGFAAYVAAMVPIMMAEQGGTNKGLISIAKLGALVGCALVGSVACERLMDMTDDLMENGITMGIKKVSISKDGVDFDVDE